MAREMVDVALLKENQANEGRDHTLRLVIIDPPMPSTMQKPFLRFSFSDISWSYVRNLESQVSEGMTMYLVGSYDVEPQFSYAKVVNVPAQLWHFRNVPTRFVLLRKYISVVRDLKPDIILSSDYLTLAVATAKCGRIPSVLITPGSILERRETYNPYGYSLTKALEWAAGKLRERGTHIAATSPYMLDWWGSMGFEGERLTMIPLPTDIRMEMPSREACRSMLGWSPEKMHFSIIANLRQENQIGSGIRAFQDFVVASGSGLPYQLHVVGGGPLEGELRGLIHELGLDNVTLHGPVAIDDLPLYYVSSDVLLVPRRYNATPRTAQEALCYGTPLITNLNKSLSGFSEFIDRFVKQVDFESSDAGRFIQQAILELRLTDDKRTHLQAESRDIFAAERVCAQFAHLCERLLPSTDGG